MAQHKLNPDKHRSIREKIADMMREAEPTQFAVEGPCRHGIRSSLCLQSWPWAMADRISAEIVATALSMAGARRPTWGEGQPEYTQPGALPILRECCSRCGKTLPEGHRRWCGDVCAQAAQMDRQRERWNEESYAMWKAGKAAWKAKQPERECAGCGKSFQPNRKEQRYCRYQCSRITA